MKNPATLVLILLSFGGCVEDWFGEKPPTRIDGLDLEFQRLKFCSDNIHFVNEQRGYLTCGNALSKTDDGGKTWTHLNIDVEGQLGDIYFLNEQVGFVAGNGIHCERPGSNCTPSNAIILHTIDSGRTWNHTALPTTSLTSVWFNSETSGFAVSPKTIFATIDGGAIWTEVTLDSPVSGLDQVQFINEQKGFITTTTGKFLTTIDGGKSWSILGPFFSAGGTLSLVRENLIFFAATYGYKEELKKIYRSFDLGNSWEEFSNLPTWYTRSLVFVSEDVAYAVGGGAIAASHDGGLPVGSIYYTTDGGVTWKGTSGVREAPIITAVHFPTPTLGYAGGHTTLIKIMKE